MPQRLHILVVAGGVPFDLTPYASSAQWDYGPAGPRALTLEAPQRLAAAVALYAGGGVARVVVSRGPRRVWAGRLRTAGLALGADGTTVTIRAEGAAAALRDIRHTTLWSASGTRGWAVLTNSDTGGTSMGPGGYEFEIARRIQISVRKGMAFPNGAALGAVAYQTPDGSSRPITGLQARARVLLPSGWSFRFTASSRDFATRATVAVVTATGGVQDLAFHLTFTGQPVVYAMIFNSTGGVSAPAGETGAWYAIISDIRVVTATASRVNTTLTANRAAGTGAASVASTAGMYVGQQLVMNGGGSPSEVVTVTAVGGTTFSATFANSYTSGQVVQGHRVTAGEVAAGLLGAIRAVNPDELQATTALIQDPGLDLTDLRYEDAVALDVLTDLAAKGDGAGTTYEVGADEYQRIFFRPRASAGRRWSITLAGLDLERPRTTGLNRMTARYQAADDRTLRSTASNAQAIAEAGLTRDGVVDADTTNATLAARIRDVALADAAAPRPAADMQIARIRGADGGDDPGDAVRPGDIVVIEGVEGGLARAIDDIRIFRVGECGFNAARGPTIVPEESLAGLDVLLAQTARAVDQ